MNSSISSSAGASSMLVCSTASALASLGVLAMLSSCLATAVGSTFGTTFFF